MQAKRVPTASTLGRRLGFDVRVRPVRRLKTTLVNGTKVFRKGAELDAYALEALRQHPTDPAGTANHGRTREAVYLDWLAERLSPAAELDRKATRLARFRRVRIARGGAGPEGPDAIIHGVLKVHEQEQFTALLTRGIGRHCAYGYGMLLLRPASRPAPER